MSDSDDFRLNALARYRKTSSQLALEVHSHCEVPAGCGGVVLRWRRPGASIGLTLSSYVKGVPDGLFLDGNPLVEQRMNVTAGAHVLSFEVNRPGDAGFVLMRARLNPEIASAVRTELASAPDGRWTATTRPPPEGWRLPDFADAGFAPLVERPVPEPNSNERWRWQMLQGDATGLGLVSSATKAWVRWSFHVDDEGFK
ncbi:MULTISPECIES: hypothetical protein [unclassified Myxococcus]|uniref:hypothetical protein n=1 Tax=unclassified Myxococcus TaxID=2648731 RepID=UPI001C3CD7E2|nr:MULTISPECIES: hypothetical protein [unclassified Myxococcus]